MGRGSSGARSIRPSEPSAPSPSSSRTGGASGGSSQSGSASRDGSPGLYGTRRFAAARSEISSADLKANRRVEIQAGRNVGTISITRHETASRGTDYSVHDSASGKTTTHKTQRGAKSEALRRIARGEKEDERLSKQVRRARANRYKTKSNSRSGWVSFH